MDEIELEGESDRGCLFDQGQYDFLKQCSEKGEEGIREWNDRRRQNPTVDIHLDGADLSGCDLKNANLMHGNVHFEMENKTVEFSGQVYLREANLEDVKGRLTSFGGAHLEKTRWTHGELEKCDFVSTHLAEARFSVCHLERCDFSDAILGGAFFTASSLCGTKFMHSDLKGCGFRAAITDGATIIWECMIDEKTDFTGVCLDAVRIDPGTKQGLEYAIRKKNWERWYRVGKPDYALRSRETMEEERVRKAQETRRCILTSPVRWFWWISDYGVSTGRILGVFFALVLAFAAVYYVATIVYPPGFVDNLLTSDKNTVQGWLVPVRAIYFSVVTMTTLGFGDMHANSQSFWGHVLLTLQVLLGYVLLGALVTRFAVLFTAGGPAGRFADVKGLRQEDKQQG